MKETLRLVMPWVGGCIGLLLLLAALLYIVIEFAFDDGRQALCDKAVETAMKSKKSYKLLEVIADEDEGPKEGRGLSSFKYVYRYQPTGYGSAIRVGILECDYVDDGRNNVEIHGKNEMGLRNSF